MSTTRIMIGRISRFDGVMCRTMVGVGIFALRTVVSVMAATNETSSFSPIFVKDGAGELRTLTWTYVVNGGQSVVIEKDEDLGAMSMRCGDLTLTVNPLAKTRERSFACYYSGWASGSGTARFTEALEELAGKVYVKSEKSVVSMNLSVLGGVMLNTLGNMLTQFSPGAEWFLDRSDLDKLGVGYEWNEELQCNMTETTAMTVRGYGSEMENAAFSGPVYDQWTIVDVLDRMQVGSRTYRNVVVVEWYGPEIIGEVNGSVEYGVTTYWVAKGVGIVKSVEPSSYLGGPFEIELKSATLGLPAVMQEQTISLSVYALSARGLGDVFDPGAKASSKLPVSYRSSDEFVAVVREDGLIEAVGAGTAVITAFQEGNDFFKAAKPISKLLTVKGRVAAEIDPPSGGTVAGTGLYALRQKVSLSAKPATGYTFLRWEDGSQTTARSLTMPNTNLTVSAWFGITTNVPKPVIADPGPQRCMVGLPFTLALDITSESLPKVTVAGLPAGLSYNTDTRSVTGVPTVSVTNKVIKVTAKNVNRTPATQAFTITVDPLPVWAQGTFNGAAESLLLGSGAASMSVTPRGGVSGKLSLGGTTYGFSAKSYSHRYRSWGGGDAFCLTTTATVGRASFPLWLAVTLPDIRASEPIVPDTLSKVEVDMASNLQVTMYRNVWKDPGMAAVLTNRFTGYCTAVLPSGGACGSGYLGFTVDKAGGVKAAGKLADGTAVSQAGTLILNENGRFLALLSTAPAAYRGGGVFGWAEFCKAAADERVILRLAVYYQPLLWENRAPQATEVYGAGFRRNLGLKGGWYDTLGNLYGYYTNRTLLVGTDDGAPAPEVGVGTNRYASAWWDPDGIVLAVVTNRSGVMTGLAAPRPGLLVREEGTLAYDYDGVINAVGLSVELNRSTGVFKGSFKAWFDYAATHTYRTIAYEGILTPERADPSDGVAGRGFFLWADKGQYLNSENRVTPYSFNWSYDLKILLFEELN